MSFLSQKFIKTYFKKITKNGIVRTKTFWNFIKPISTNSSHHKENNIILIKDDKIVSEEKGLVETSNKH